MAFQNVLFPVDIALGAQGGPGWNTTVVVTASGLEKRNQNWSGDQSTWDVGYGVKTRAQMDTLLQFFQAMRGKFHSWRLHDYNDYTQATKYEFGLGDGSNTTWQLYRLYAVGSLLYAKVVTKPVASASSLYVNNVLQSSGYTIDETTGLVTFTAPPSPGAVLAWTGQFDKHCRFDTDELRISWLDVQHAQAPSIPIIEIKE